MGIVLLAEKEQGGGAFPSLRGEKGDFQETESLKYSCDGSLKNAEAGTSKAALLWVNGLRREGGGKR